MKTEFKDHAGKPLHVGDIVIYQLGSSGKSGGPNAMQVIKTKKGIKLVDQHGQGWLMRKTYEQYITLIDTRYREDKDT